MHVVRSVFEHTSSNSEDVTFYPIISKMGTYSRPTLPQTWAVRHNIVFLVVLLAVMYVGYCCVSFTSAGSALDNVFQPKQLAALSDDEKKAQIRAELGRGTWNMLHRFAARFEKEPTDKQQQEARDFIRLLGEFYPCPDCAKHFREMLAKSPPDVSDNRALSMWFCERHNEVNARLGKQLFPCTLEALAERYGECGCFGNATSTGEEGAAGAKASAGKRRLGHGAEGARAGGRRAKGSARSAGETLSQVWA